MFGSGEHGCGPDTLNAAVGAPRHGNTRHGACGPRRWRRPPPRRPDAGGTPAQTQRLSGGAPVREGTRVVRQPGHNVSAAAFGVVPGATAARLWCGSWLGSAGGRARRRRGGLRCGVSSTRARALLRSPLSQRRGRGGRWRSRRAAPATSTWAWAPVTSMIQAPGRWVVHGAVVPGTVACAGAAGSQGGEAVAWSRAGQRPQPSSTVTGAACAWMGLWYFLKPWRHFWRRLRRPGCAGASRGLRKGRRRPRSDGCLAIYTCISLI